MNSLEEATMRLKNIIKMSAIIWNGGNKENIAKLHHINDHYQNERERIIYGDTLKNIRERNKNG